MLKSLTIGCAAVASAAVVHQVNAVSEALGCNCSLKGTPTSIVQCVIGKITTKQCDNAMLVDTITLNDAADVCLDDKKLYFAYDTLPSFIIDSIELPTTCAIKSLQSGSLGKGSGCGAFTLSADHDVTKFKVEKTDKSSTLTLPDDGDFKPKTPGVFLVTLDPTCKTDKITDRTGYKILAAFISQTSGVDSRVSTAMIGLSALTFLTLI